MEKITLGTFYPYRSASKECVIRFVTSLGLISSVYKCPECGKAMKLKQRVEANDGFEWRCRLDYPFPHKVRRSVRCSSVFFECRLPMIDFLIMTHLFVHKVPMSFVGYELNLSRETVNYWHKSFREVCTEMCLRMNSPIGGADKIVEIDENGLGELSRRKREDGEWVIAGLERGSKNCFIKVVKKKGKEALYSVIKKYVLPGTTVYSHLWKTYDCLEDPRFKHLSADRSLVLIDFKFGTVPNALDSTWSAIKRSVSSRSVKGQFDSYLGECLWRRSCSDSNDLTKAFLDAVKVLYAPRCRDKWAVEVGGKGVALKEELGMKEEVANE